MVNNLKTNESRKKIPLILTITRIGLTPFILCLIAFDSQPFLWMAAALFILASITDYFDGYLARKWDVRTSLGALLDPVADKIMILSVLIMLIPNGYLGSGYAGPVMVITFLIRDILIGAIRAAAANENLVIAADSLGKYKATLQMIAIPALLIGDFFSLPIRTISVALLWGAVALSTISGIQYITKYIKVRV